MRQKILKLLAGFVGLENPEEIRPEDNLSDLGLTSILFIQFIVKLEETFSIEILDSDLTLRKFETVEIMFETLEKYFTPETPLKKVLVCDCDHVLWQGVAGEEELQVGPVELNVQKILVNLVENGVLLCLCSKNEEENIRLALSRPENFLTWEHIVAFRINRRDKAANLLDLASELNLSPDSFVFVDDSDYELGLVSGLLPQILTVKADDQGRWAEEIADLFEVSSLEERNRTVLYREQKEREKEKAFFSTVEEYNRSLLTEVHCDLASLADLPRLAELSRRTNQCNLSLARYSEEDLRRLYAEPSVSVFSLSAADRYGDMGIVGGAVLRKTEVATMESFFVSCRVFERGFEEILLEKLRSEAGNLPLQGCLRKSEKNKRYHDFYEKMGVTVCE